MQRKNYKNRVKLLTIGVLAAMAYVVGQPGILGCGQAAAQEPGNVFGYQTTLEQRIGQDDGADFIVRFAGDTHGSLDTCGCKGRLAGGMAREAGFVRAAAAKLQGIPALLVDTGYFLSDTESSHGFLPGYSSVQDEFVLEAFERFDVGVGNVSVHDLPFLAAMTGDGKDQLPFIRKLVSANVVMEPQHVDSRQAASFQPFVVKEVSSRRISGEQQHTIRVAFVGLAEADKPAPPGFKVADPVETAARIVPEARRQADVVIVLAHLKAAQASVIARQVPGINAVIDGDEGSLTKSVREGSTLVVFTPFETEMLGELRFYRDPKGGITVKDRYIGLDNLTPEEPAVLTLVASAKAAAVAASKRFGSPSPWLPVDKTDQSRAGFVSAQQCSKCHLKEYMQWINSGHGNAGRVLEQKMGDVDMTCLRCHMTGVVPGATWDTSDLHRFGSVQCEQCHGPGRDHVAKPDKSYGHIAALKPLCSTCHTARTDPSFEVAAAWEKIKH